MSTRKKFLRRAWDFCRNEHHWDDKCHSCDMLADAFEQVVAEASQRSETPIAGALWKRADELIVKLTAHCAGVDLPNEEEYRKAVQIIMDALEGK